MGWITQQYDNGVHVVPDTEPDHVLDPKCFCEPRREQDPDMPVPMFVHRDQLDRERTGEQS